MVRDSVLAWVESPLQLLGAAEWAEAHARRVDLAARVTPQVPTAARAPGWAGARATRGSGASRSAAPTAA